MVDDVGEPWRGVLIEESFSNKSVFQYVRIVSTRSEALEGGKDRREFRLHNVEVAEAHLSQVLESGATTLKPKGWYFHLVKGDTMKVVFPGKVFQACRSDTRQLENIRLFGMSVGIPGVQMGFEAFFGNPYNE